MIGATQAVEDWIRRRHAKAWAEGYAKGWEKGYAEGQAEVRQRIRDGLLPLAENNPELKKKLDELTNGDANP